MEEKGAPIPKLSQVSQVIVFTSCLLFLQIVSTSCLLLLKVFYCSY